MFVFKIHKKECCLPVTPTNSILFFIRNRYLFQHTTVSQSPLTGQNINSMDASYIPIAEARGFTTHWKKALLFTPFSVTRSAGYYQRTTKKACRKRQTCKM